MSKKKKLCFVVQRYSADISGGGEALCAQYVDLLRKDYDITVLTSCALDYNTWENVFSEGASRENGVEVVRFSSVQKRDKEVCAELTIQMFGNPYNEFDLCAKWLRSIGPECPELLRYLKEHKQEFKLIVFTGYLYYTTTFGLPMAPEKSVLIPTAHDEDALNRCNYFKAQFNAPKAFIYLTEEEKNFVQSKFKNHRIPSTVIGAPINIDHREFMNDIDICRQFGIKDRYILYIGRIDQTKNCEDLIECFQYYKKMHPGNLKLVMAGNVYMELPEGEDFLPIGFVDESAKKALLQQASALVLASKYESLSLVTLESMAAGVPVLLRGQSIVLKAHAEKSNAGLYFYEKYDFEQALHFILTNKNLAKGMAQNGKKYVYDNYRYTIIKQKLVNFIESL